MSTAQAQINALRRDVDELRRLLTRSQVREGLIRTGTTFVEGKLTTALTAASNGGRTSTTATLQLYGGTGDAHWDELTDRTITITNRSTRTTAAVGVYVIAVQVPGGEWRAIWVDC